MTAGIPLILRKTGAHIPEAARCRACASRSAATADTFEFLSFVYTRKQYGRLPGWKAINEFPAAGSGVDDFVPDRVTHEAAQ